MSGAFGRSGNSQSGGGGGDNTGRGWNYQSAYDGHQSPHVIPTARTPQSTQPPPAKPAAVQPPYRTTGPKANRAKFAANAKGPTPGCRHNAVVKASNLVIVAVDSTGSFQKWWDQIFERLPLFWDELTKTFGTDDIEVLFIAFNDAKSCHQYAIQVADLAKGLELEVQLGRLLHRGGGGADGEESPELAAYWVATKLDIRSAQNIFFFTLTDEAGAGVVDSVKVSELFGDLPNKDLLNTAELYGHLRGLMHVNTILVMTTHADYNPTSIDTWWRKTLTGGIVCSAATMQPVDPVISGGLIRLDTAERVVDTMILTIAETFGPAHGDSAMSRFSARQSGKQYEAVNRKVMSQMQSQLRSRESTPHESASPTAPLI